MEHHDFHSIRVLVGERHDRRLREASAERLARQIRGTARIDLRRLFGAVLSAIRRTPTARPVRTRPEW